MEMEMPRNEEKGIKEQCLYTLQFANDQAIIGNDRKDIGRKGI